MKSTLLTLLLLASTTAFSLENKTHELPWTDVPAQNAPTIAEFCDNVIDNSEMLKWGTRTQVSCSKKVDGTVDITATSKNRLGVVRSLTITGKAEHVMYMEISGGDYFYKYKNDQGEILNLNTQFIHTSEKLNWKFWAVEEKGYYQGDLRLVKGETSMRFGFTDLEN